MTKSELVAKLAAQNQNLYLRDIETIVDTILEEMSAALERGDRIELRGFGAFSVKERQARVGRNPRTGEQVKVDAKRLAEVRAGVERLFAAVERECGVRGRWMHRRDDAATYMEVYEDVKDSAKFEAVLQRESAGLGLQRRTELFVSA